MPDTERKPQTDAADQTSSSSQGTPNEGGPSEGGRAQDTTTAKDEGRERREVLQEARASAFEGIRDVLLKARISAFNEIGDPAPVYDYPVRRVNGSAVFKGCDLYLNMEEDHRTRVGIKLIKDIHGWQTAIEWVLQKGQYRGASEPLSLHGQYYQTREEALDAAKEELTNRLREAAENDHRNPDKAKREAKELREWLVKAVRRPEWFDDHTPDPWSKRKRLRRIEAESETADDEEEDTSNGEGEEAAVEQNDQEGTEAKQGVLF